MSSTKPKIVGLYGIPGSGKTYLKNELKILLNEDEYAFYDGSDMIAAVPKGLQAFKLLSEDDKRPLREAAIQRVVARCASSGKVGVVTGHLMLWSEKDNLPTSIYTTADLAAYTHIIYLDISSHAIQKQRQDDEYRKDRANDSIEHIRKHKQAEMAKLQEVCRDNGILFMSVQQPERISPDVPRSLAPVVGRLLADFIVPSDLKMNTYRALADLDAQLLGSSSTFTPEAMLVIDGDKTLAPCDTGNMFWDMLRGKENTVLKTLFDSELGYSYEAFQQAVLLYEQSSSKQEFDEICAKVAADVTLYPEVLSLLKEVATCDHINVVVATCGLRRVWELVLRAAGLSPSVHVIGGSRIEDRYVVTPEVKAEIVAHLQRKYHSHVCAIGDSPLDAAMMQEADQAVVVVGDHAIRSSTMESYLQQMKFGTSAQKNCLQVLLPGSRAVTKLNIAGLPVGTLSSLSLLAPKQWLLDIMDAGTSRTSKILASSTRDARLSGLTLQKAHRKIGWYLAMHYLTKIIDLESFKLPHVQGGTTTGHRLLGEARTTIIALMRGGEPMAFGVHEALPSASFLHASQPADIELEHVKDQETIILVDSVINSGKSISEHVNHIRAFKCPARIIVIAGVVQEAALQENGLVEQLRGYGRLSIVCLRKSANKYTGRGGTDTGNRLFNTAYLD